MKNTELIPLISTLIAALITLIGVLINFFVFRKQISNSNLQFKFKEQEIKSVQERLNEEMRIKNMLMESTRKNLKSVIEVLKKG